MVVQYFFISFDATNNNACIIYNDITKENMNMNMKL